MTVTPATRDVLAIHGGPPVRKTLLPYGHQSIDEGDIQAVMNTLRSAWLTTGPRVRSLKKRLPRGLGRSTRSASVLARRHCTRRPLQRG